MYSKKQQYQLRLLPAPRWVLGLFLLAASPAVLADCVVLLHGLARTATAMEALATSLDNSGFKVANVDYPSREKTIEELAPMAIEEGLQRCGDTETIHFVTHSMGGILVRYYLQHNTIEALGHVVMIAPPNQGSEVVDMLAETPGFHLINGPAGLQLGTDADSVPSQLGPVEFSLGIIAGSSTFNPLLSQLLPNPDDGKVSVQSTQVEGMVDFLLVDASHPFIMNDERVIRETIYFLRTGRFENGQLPESAPMPAKATGNTGADD